ncbi:MAG: VWA domain-containing protein, partial [Deltaproteobacteria bacterium]|nr:VWA domain-containing protein [Deltaproteobacteria bacterium]
RVRIHAVGFPVVMDRTNKRGNTGERFATLMRPLCHRNGCTFVGLNSTDP